MSHRNTVKLPFMLKKICCVIVSLSLVLLPTASFAELARQVRVEWSYDTSMPDLAGYNFYQNGAHIAAISDPTALWADLNVILETGASNIFTMTAFDTAYVETPHSGEYIIDVPPEDETGNVLPLAKFNVSEISGEAPFAVDFDAAPSVDYDGVIVDYSWDFGDGDSGGGDFANHIFSSPGLYTVILLVTDDEGALNQSEIDITVTDAGAGDNASPTADIDASVIAGDAPLSVNFDGGFSADSDGVIVSYSWDFGDGDSGSGEFVEHAFVAAGVYSVVLTVTDDGGATAAETVDITVTSPVELENVGPTAVMTYGYKLPTTSFGWEYTAGPDLAGFRLSVDGNQECEIADPAARQMDCPIYVGVDVLDITLTAFDTSGNESNVSNTFVLNPVVLPDSVFELSAPLDVRFSAENSTDSDGTIVSYSWDFGDGETGVGETVDHTYAVAG
ncbi:MAG: PKD domain-containing protein, partial [Desulfobulbaceae bacterium]|nr:PKD domain-containing protein [Desulfobulbaceae bacterium]